MLKYPQYIKSLHAFLYQKQFKYLRQPTSKILVSQVVQVPQVKLNKNSSITSSSQVLQVTQVKPQSHT